MWGIVSASSMFLWLLPLAALPILFHLFLKVRKQVRPFPSLMFFLQAEPRLSARKRIREWLTLLLRITVIAALLLALARLLWLGQSGGGAIAQVLLIDNSGSMSGNAPDGRTKLANALDAASGLISDMGPADSIALVLLVEDPAAALPSGFSANKQLLHTALERIKITHGSGAPAQSLMQAFSILGTASTARREIHILTDAQDTEWAKPPHANRSPPSGTAITLHRIRTLPHETPNVSVGEIELPRRSLVADRHYAVNVTLQNLSKKEARVRLNSLDSSGVKHSLPAEIPPQTSRTITLPIETHQAGANWLTVDLENDAFEPDNHSSVAFICQPRKKVLFCGPESTFGMIPLAVSPSGDGSLSGLIPVFKQKERSLTDLLKEPPAMVVLRPATACATPADQAALSGYLEKGGNILVLPDLKTTTARENVPPWLRLRFGQPISNEKGQPVMVLNKTQSIWDDLKNDTGEVMVNQTKVFSLLPLLPLPGQIPLLALQDGTPLLAQQNLKKGTLFISGIELDSKASTLPLKAAFVALIHNMALTGQNPGGNTTTLLAGTKPAGQENPDLPVQLHAFTGGVMEWQGPGRNLPALPRAGIYSLEANHQTSFIAVRSAIAEGRESFVAAEKIPALADLSHQVEDYQDSESLIRLVRRLRTGVELFLPLLLLALCAAVAEGLIVNPAALAHPGKAPVHTSIMDRISIPMLLRFWKGRA